MKKLSTVLSLIIGVLGKRCWRGGEGQMGQNKWNQGKIIEISLYWLMLFLRDSLIIINLD